MSKHRSHDHNTVHLHRPGRPTPGRDQGHRVWLTRATPPWICVDNAPWPQYTHESAPAVPMQTPLPTRKETQGQHPHDTHCTDPTRSPTTHRLRHPDAASQRRQHHDASGLRHCTCPVADIRHQTHPRHRLSQPQPIPPHALATALR